MSHKIKIIKEELEKLYKEQNLSASEIAKIYNCSNTTILNWIKRFNLNILIKKGFPKGRKNSKISGDKSSTKKLEVRLKMSQNHADVSGNNNPNFGATWMYGKNNPNWKGGIKSFIKCLRDSKEYNEWRISIYKNYDYTCQSCYKRGYELHAHHKIPFALLIKDFLKQHADFDVRKNKSILLEMAKNHDKLWDINNGIVFCKKCHSDIHPNMNCVR